MNKGGVKKRSFSDQGKPSSSGEKGGRGINQGASGGKAVRGLCWLRRDLRLKDNRALFSACKMSDFVLAAFVFDTNILSRLKNKKDRRVFFIFQSLRELDRRLKEKGSRLFTLYGDPVTEIPKICEKLRINSVFTNEDYENYGKKRDHAVEKNLRRKGIRFYSFKDHVVFAGTEAGKKDGTAYRVFTPYKKAWLKKLSPEDLKIFRPSLNKLLPYSCFKNQFQDRLSRGPESVGFQKPPLSLPAGESSGSGALKNFSGKIKTYHRTRDQFQLNGTSRLSVHLRFGTVSVRDCVRFALKRGGDGARAWLSELIWRDFYHSIMDGFGYVEKKAFLKKYQSIKWPNSKKFFKAWCEGKTGYPIVDAAMRQLNETGWMPNRLRMITAGFLTKDLLTDWRKGEAWFAEKLLDFDRAANNGGWQWSASTGCDAQPYFRVFNPVTQSMKFDPKAIYIKTWLPRLRPLDDRAAHFPLRATRLPEGFQLGVHYPFPIVEHEVQRQKAVTLFKKYSR